MKIKISRNIRKYIILYLALILILYLVIEMVPRMTTAFETTQILEPGNLVLTCEATGYVIKEEVISIAPESGSVKYLVKDGTPVSKSRKVVEIQDSGATMEASRKYADLMDGLDGYSGIFEKKKAPISGIFCLSMDGSEQAMNPAHMDSLTYEKVKELPMKARSLETGAVAAGDPMYKVTDDNKWYVVCWLDKEEAGGYSEGQDMKLNLPAGSVDATIRSVTKEEDRYKVIFYTDMYYKELATSREVEMTITSSDRSGLLVDNECLIEKEGKQGVYVRNKNGDYYFVQVNVIETDGKQSVISESSYYDPEKEDIVYTVSVYDEVLKQPEKALKQELKEQEKEKEQKEQ